MRVLSLMACITALACIIQRNNDHAFAMFGALALSPLMGQFLEPLERNGDAK